MNIQINTDKNISGQEAMVEHVAATVESTFGHLAEHLTCIEIYLSDENNDKTATMLIYRLTYRRNNHHNLHVRGYKEEGIITTPFGQC